MKGQEAVGQLLETVFFDFIPTFFGIFFFDLLIIIIFFVICCE